MFVQVIHLVVCKLPILDETNEIEMNFLIDMQERCASVRTNYGPSVIRQRHMATTIEVPIVDDDDDVAMAMDLQTADRDVPSEVQQIRIQTSLIVDGICTIFNRKEFCNKINFFFTNTDALHDQYNLNQLSLDISYICFFLLIKSKLKMHESTFLSTIAFNKQYLCTLWKSVCMLTFKPNERQEINLIQLLASGNNSGVDIYDRSLFQIIPSLITFCSLYNLFLLPILDEEFLKGKAIFSKEELIRICSILKDICLGMIRLMHPDTKPLALGFNETNTTNEADIKLTAIYFTHLFMACSQLVQRMHTRDIRSGFCPEDHWLSNTITVTASRLTSVYHSDQPVLKSIKFGQLSYLFQQTLDPELKLSVNDVRSLTVLQELPFVVSFKDRVQIFENFLSYEPNYVTDRLIKIRVRRNYLYEDAFDNLSLDNGI